MVVLGTQPGGWVGGRQRKQRADWGRRAVVETSQKVLRTQSKGGQAPWKAPRGGGRVVRAGLLGRPFWLDVLALTRQFSAAPRKKIQGGCGKGCAFYAVLDVHHFIALE